jgi:hypothetical protein
MLGELLSFLLTPASRHARRLGHVAEGIAILARHRRCRAAWQPHLLHCHAAILAAVGACRRRERVVVLGSGGLLDVPLEELAARFAQVVLIDVFHPRPALRRARRLANVVVLSHDLLGLDQPGGWALAPSRLGAWRALVAPADLVISVNLLAQLPLKPLDHWSGPPEKAEPWARAVMAAHLADLRDGPGQALLISEWRRQWFGLGGLTDEEAPLAGLDLPPPSRLWTWDLAPRGELAGDEILRVDIAAYAFGWGWLTNPPDCIGAIPAP